MSEFVEDEDLNRDLFHCCGDEELLPFACPDCGRPMVYCLECDTLYDDLHDLKHRGEDLNYFEPDEPIFSCPQCSHDFEFYFMRNPRLAVARADWVAKGFEHLLKVS
jgi:hypothetical protein